MRKMLALVVFICFLLSAAGFLIQAQSSPVISNISIDPELDISLFSSYTITADIDPYDSADPVTIQISGINGDGSEYWDFFVDGTPASETLNFDMSYVSGSTWHKANVYPDYIYPEIFFAPSEITWYEEPADIVVRRNDYHLLHFNNPFSMTDDMSFWIEFNAKARANNSADMQVYLVEQYKNINFFESDWRNSDSVELVGTINRNTDFHHRHTGYSSHHLISLSTNEDGTIGSKSLNISNDFWIILYNTSPNNNRGWDLRYHDSSLCTNDNRWYRGNQIGWSTTAQAGCPDAHIHIARRAAETMDGVEVVITAGETTETQEFYFGELPNLPPNPTNFTNPLAGTYSDLIEIEWSPASDPNNDPLTYNIYLLDKDGSILQTLIGGTAETSFSFDSTTVDDGSYGLKGEVCDTEPLCTEFFSEDNFLIDNTDDIFSLSYISIESDNIDSFTAASNNTVTLTFAATGVITEPQVFFYSGGEEVIDSPIVTDLGSNNWQAQYVVDANDTEGYISFIINSVNLASEYFETTDESSVVVSFPEPTPTPTPSPTAAPTPTLIPEPTPTPTPEPETETNQETDTKTETGTSSDSGSPSPPRCSYSKPFFKPDLFQINTTTNTAALFFTPSGYKEYYVSYSTSPHAEEHGEKVILGSLGVQQHTVYLLKPNTVYYFKVRAHNRCMPGDWSNVLPAMTNRATAYRYDENSEPAANGHAAITTVLNPFNSWAQQPQSNQTASGDEEIENLKPDLDFNEGEDKAKKTTAFDEQDEEFDSKAQQLEQPQPDTKQFFLVRWIKSLFGRD